MKVAHKNKHVWGPASFLVAVSLLSLPSCGNRGSGITPSPEPESNASLSSSFCCEELYFSEGLRYEQNEARTGYIVMEIGTCSDVTIQLPSTYLDLPVIGIGKEAFKDNDKITSIAFPSSIKSIGEGAFSGCAALTNVSINDGLTTIGDEAFYWCHALNTIDLPDSLTSIGQLAFFDSGLARNPVNYVDNALLVDGWICSAQSVSGDYVVPSSIIGLSEYVFSNNNKVTSIDIPVSVVHYGSGHLFDFSDKLTSITIERNVNPGSYVLSRFHADASFHEENRIRYIK